METFWRFLFGFSFLGIAVWRSSEYRDSKRAAAISLSLLFVASGGVIWSRPYKYVPVFQGSDMIRLERRHWLRPNEFMLLYRGYDRAFETAGWCIRVNGVQHLVFCDDGETVMPTLGAWWKDY